MRRGVRGSSPAVPVTAWSVRLSSRRSQLLHFSRGRAGFSSVIAHFESSFASCFISLGRAGYSSVRLATYRGVWFARSAWRSLIREATSACVRFLSQPTGRWSLYRGSGAVRVPSRPLLSTPLLWVLKVYCVGWISAVRWPGSCTNRQTCDSGATVLKMVGPAQRDRDWDDS